MAFHFTPAGLKVFSKARTKNSKEVLRRLQEYLEGNCGKLAVILCGFWKDQQDAITYQELRQMLAEDAALLEVLKLWQQDYSVLVKEKLESIWKDAAMAGPAGQPVLDSLNIKSGIYKSGMDWINRHGAEFVTSCTREQKDAIAALVAKKMKDRYTVDELARLIRPCIGLTERDAKAASRLYDNIVENMKKEHPRMKPESIKRKALDATQKYAERKLRQRAYTIAQTECAFAYNRGAYESIKQAQAQNLMGAVKNAGVHLVMMLYVQSVIRLMGLN